MQTFQLVIITSKNMTFLKILKTVSKSPLNNSTWKTSSKSYGNMTKSTIGWM